ncbi:hypothetical protein B0F90DRAFT_130273 [Multifurca ochricompacta]|uniref:Uncharacterized protein n=1 Tax=Multifurca ochricompacta TaxID=376703 RepID=A0AAD4QUD0_9AGAM|nr:hypothetical protein B0F90DRAFT_130273 [Multifurca ochricompacta]
MGVATLSSTISLPLNPMSFRDRPALYRIQPIVAATQRRFYCLRLVVRFLISAVQLVGSCLFSASKSAHVAKDLVAIPICETSMSSIQSVHVHFPALLEQPPVDRVRKRGLVYPKLAQSKGSGDRMHSTDLFWGSRGVSAAIPEPKSKAKETVPRGIIHFFKSPLKLDCSRSFRLGGVSNSTQVRHPLTTYRLHFSNLPMMGGHSM